MLCDLCGKETEVIYKVEIEGTILNVCKDCSSFGKIIDVVKREEKPKIEKKKIVKKEEKEIHEMIVEDYAVKIKKAREKKNLKQEELAKLIAEKVSLIRSIEKGKHEPSIQLARKLEKVLNIHLIEEYEYRTDNKSKESKSDKLTLGDVIKIKQN